MRLSFHAQVSRETNEARTWYEEQRTGLGGEFFEGFTVALQQIQSHPERFGFWLESKFIRRLKMKRFPYDILFEIKPDRVRILCLRHEKRHPSFGMHRQ